MSTNVQLQAMSDQELPQYFARSRDERAYQEILRLRPNAGDRAAPLRDREALEQFLQWEQEQKN